MISRRDFLTRAAQLVALGFAGDQLDLIERLTWKRRLFPGADFRSRIVAGEDLAPGALCYIAPDGKLYAAKTEVHHPWVRPWKQHRPAIAYVAI